LATLHLNLYYLPDDRRLESPFSSATDDQHLRVFVDDEQIVRRHLILQHEFQAAQSNPLEAALRRTVEWIRSEALRASNIGQANANTIYATIVQQILRTRGSRSKTRPEDLAGELRELEHRSRLFSSYGLTSELDISELAAGLRTAAGEKREVMEDVLRPYVDGLKARLDAMQRLQTLLAAFLNSLNSFFTNKTVKFTIDEGFQIVSRNGEVLAPSALSSGEKQLLLLFCNVVAAKDQAAIFLLDEPELSLNIKWQRKLLQTLLELIGDSPVQLLVATHSLELLSGYRSNVLRLTDTQG
jgi:predicted ATPase